MIGALILAAGRSSRMGRPKAFLPHRVTGQTFVAHLIGAAQNAGISHVFVVGRPEDDDLRKETAARAAAFVPNPCPDEGQLSSLLAGLSAAEVLGAGAVVVLPVDVPGVTSAVIGAIVEASARSAASIVRASHQGRHGHPVLFKKEVFEELRAADARMGARAVVRAEPGRVLDLEVGDPRVTEDIDTPADYARVFGREL